MATEDTGEPLAPAVGQGQGALDDLSTWLVVEVVALLRAHGVDDAAIPDSEHRAFMARQAALDLLERLGVHQTKIPKLDSYLTS